MSNLCQDLPVGWQRIDELGQPYTKLVKRDAVAVPKRAHGEPFHRDSVVVITNHVAAVVQGPGARQSWQTDDPDAVGVRLAHAVESWIQDGGDPYGGSELNARLDDAA